MNSQNYTNVNNTTSKNTRSSRQFKIFQGSNVYTEWEGKVPTTIFSSCPITTSPEYNKIVDKERTIILGTLVVLVLTGPLVFRYVLGSRISDVDDEPVVWASEMDGWEWGVIMVLFLGFIGSVLRLIPVISGRPAAVESTQKCVLDGVAAMGIASPFASEDDTVLLRSLIGRTVTVFSTVGSRHSIHGLYIDCILNEKRIKGEANRRAIWVAWMKFLSALVDVCMRIKEDELRQEEAAKTESSRSNTTNKENEEGLKAEIDQKTTNPDSNDLSAPTTTPDEGVAPELTKAQSPVERPAHRFVSTLPTIPSSGNFLGNQTFRRRRARRTESMYDDDDDFDDEFGDGALPDDASDTDEIEMSHDYTVVNMKQDEMLGPIAAGRQLLRSISKSKSHSVDRGELTKQTSARYEGGNIPSTPRSTGPLVLGKGHSVKISTDWGLSPRHFDTNSSEFYHNSTSPHFEGVNPSLSININGNNTTSEEEHKNSSVPGLEKNRFSPREYPINNFKAAAMKLESSLMLSMKQRDNIIASFQEKSERFENAKQAFTRHARSASVDKTGEQFRAINLENMHPGLNKDISFKFPQENVNPLPQIAINNSLRPPMLTIDHPETSAIELRTRGMVPASPHRLTFNPSTPRVTPRGGGPTAIKTPRNAQNMSAMSDDTGGVQLKALELFALGQMNTSSEKETPDTKNMNRRSMEVIQRWDNSYANSNGLPSLKFNMADILPLVTLLHGWMTEMKENEWTFDYHQPKLALDKLFFACPFMRTFETKYILPVHAAVMELYDAFTKTVKDEPDPKQPVQPDDINEVEWIIQRSGMPDWTVVWSFASRSRLRELKRENINDPYGPDAVYNNVRIKPGAIIYQKVPYHIAPDFYPMLLFESRSNTLKVDKIVNTPDGKMVYAYPFPLRSTTDVEAAVDNDVKLDESIPVALPLDQVSLLEKNRGKTGALNFFNDYLRARTVQWSAEIGMNHPVQTFTGIIDARHALVEPEIFWNDALPYFSLVGATGEPGKRFGGLYKHALCCMVQYPQFFSNVSATNDWLDNTCSSYYNLWQSLRDCGKCITSSGTNAIWDISDVNFEFCTTSRSEDLGTSHKCIPYSAAVYLCINVSYAVAKKTEDFLEALYRWSAGPLELLFISFFDPKLLYHHIMVAVPVGITAAASFAEEGYWYFIYLGMLGLFGLQLLWDKYNGRKPLRDFAVSTVVVINLFIVMSNLLSITWFVFFPIRIAFYGTLPMTRNDTRALFWGWVSIFFALPTGIFHDSLIKIARHTAPATANFNYHRSLWRGSQLYACSFMFTLLATIAGTFSAYKAWRYDLDLSMWSSFRVGANELKKLFDKVKKAPLCSVAFFSALYAYLSLYFQSCLATLTMPTEMTRFYVTFVFCLQFVCAFVSTFITNVDKSINLVVLLFVTGLNVLMTINAAILLQPKLGACLGFPVRAEYVFAYIGIFIIIVGIFTGALNVEVIRERVKLE